jgi:opacity protein-like surface antigen
MIDQSFVGVDGKRAFHKDGFAERRQAFDARGNMIERTYFGVDGKPTRFGNGGYAKVVWAYNARDEVTEESYFGVDGKPAHDSGCVRITYTYDDLGHETDVTYWDTLNKSIPVEVTIGSVFAGQVGARAGLLVGDRVLTYAGQRVTSIKRFEELTSSPITGFYELTVRRGSEILKFTVPSGELNISLVLRRADSDAVIAPAVPGN